MRTLTPSEPRSPVRRMLRRVHRLLSGKLPAMPFSAASVQFSAVASLHDDAAAPSAELIELLLRAAKRAGGISMEAIAARMVSGPSWPLVWPGEHYKLLGALVEELRPSVAIEIGTFQGLSALSIWQHLPPGAVLHTFDVIPWREIRESALREGDFADGRLVQELADLADPSEFARYASLLQRAELVFVDGPKNIKFERALIAALDGIALPKRPIVVFDDIRTWTMLAIWREIRHPKLDATSFGHWSGTGLVHWI